MRIESIAQGSACAALLVLTACGAADGTTEGPDPSDVHAEQQRIQQALGEAACGSTTSDYTAPIDNPVWMQSPDGNYDHPTCGNAFIVDFPGALAGQTIQANVADSPVTPIPDLLCLFEYSYVGLWKKEATGYVPVWPSFSLGFSVELIPAPGSIGFQCIAPSLVTIPSDGDYKVVTAAGTLFGPTKRVSVLKY